MLTLLLRQVGRNRSLLRRRRHLSPIFRFGVSLLVVFMLPSLGRAQRAEPPNARDRSPAPDLRTSPPPGTFGPVDWIFLIDLSKSMRQPPADPLVGRVKSTLRQFIGAVHPGDSLAVYVFDTDSRPVFRHQVTSQDDLSALTRQIDVLRADGDWTHTGAALKDGLREAYGSSDRHRNDPRPAAIILLTDGMEDVRGIPPEKRVMVSDAIRLIRDDSVPYVFYVSLGTALDPGLLAFVGRINAAAAGRGGIVAAPGANNLTAEAEKIRIRLIIEKRPLVVRPDKMSLGRLRLGQVGESEHIDINSPVDAYVTVRPFEIPSDVDIEGLPADQVRVGPERATPVRFRVRARADANEGLNKWSLRVTPVSPPSLLLPNPSTVELTVTVYKAWWQRLLEQLPWLLPLLVLLGLLLYFAWQWFVLDVRPAETPLWRLVSRPFRRDEALDSPALAEFELLGGGEPLPIRGDTMNVNNSLPQLSTIAAKIVIVAVGNAHEMISEEGHVRFRLADSDFQDLAPNDRRTLQDLSEIEIQSQDHRPALVLRYRTTSAPKAAFRRAD